MTSQHFADTLTAMKKPPRPPEGVLIERYRETARPKISARAAARIAGVSDTRWRQIVEGTSAAGPADTVARMAQAVGVPTAELEAVRPDAAAEARYLEEVAASQGVSPTQIATARVVRGIERTEMAAAWGVSPEEVQRWEAGALVPPAHLPAVKQFVFGSNGDAPKSGSPFADVPDSALLAELIRRARIREERRRVV